MTRFSVLLGLVVTSALQTHIRAQPSPDVQRRISDAISAAANATEVDYTAFVNPFIGTDNYGDVW